ncbi:hypothetical protein PUN28_000693 [Cardiocondyla obscurior]|uniref:Uncharacterized protein n=1 Tax=Cardiocondyla obscurior TaxID=286306 RepID=A0AAW2H0M1_9HYME
MVDLRGEERARNRSVLRRRKAERRTAAVISSRRDWPNRGTRGSVDGQWRPGLGFSRILPPEIRRVLCATYTRARARPRCIRNPRLFQPHIRAHTSRPLPTGRPVSSPSSTMSSYFVYSTLRQPHDDLTRRSPSGPFFLLLANISPGSISDSRHNDPTFFSAFWDSQRARRPDDVGTVLRRKENATCNFPTHLRITRIEFISFSKFSCTRVQNRLQFRVNIFLYSKNIDNYFNKNITKHLNIP